MSGWDVVANKDLFGGPMQMVLSFQWLGQSRQVVTALEYQEQIPGEVIPDGPWFSGFRAKFGEIEDGGPANVEGFMQAVLDEAWRLGMRPGEFVEHEAELKATDKHLEDMRKIVGKQLKVEFS